MKRAALYARVSTDIQKEEGTIKSQLFELKQQITRDGHTLAKEYVDEGWSGARLDRPALDQMRSDLKLDLFDVIYFHNVDRIARDVTYQQLIISDLIKYRKQIIINGKDYVENPENKFALTVLGAVAELEKAKFAERSARGRRHKVRQGIPATGGNAPYGYKLIHKTDTKPQHIVIDEKRAILVRLMYETYANTEIGINELTRKAQETGMLSAHGKMWSRSSIHFMITNTAYYGEINYYTVRKVPATGSRPRHVRFKTVPRDPSEQMSISIPPIISKELWDKVQAKLNHNKRVYRHSPRKYLLSGLVQCARDGKSYTGYAQSWENHILKYRYYGCNHNRKMYGADYNIDRDRCTNKSISATRLEAGVWYTIINEILNPTVLKTHVEVLRTRTRDRDNEYRKQLADIEKKLKANQEQKLRILDLYTDGYNLRETLTRKMTNLEEDEKKLRAKQADLAETVTLIPDPKLVRKSITLFCEQMCSRVSRITDFAGKRNFLLDAIDSIVFDEDALQIRGFIPLVFENINTARAVSARSAVRCPMGELLHLWSRKSY